MTRDEVIREVLDASVTFVDEAIKTAPMFDFGERVVRIPEKTWRQLIAAVSNFKRAEDDE